jgi:hypothetical protein
MEEQIPASQVPQQPQGISPEQLAEMKARAREQAIRMSLQQQPFFLQVPQPPIKNLPYRPDIPQMQRAPEPAYDYSAPKIIYQTRNLTIAEILVMFVLSCVVVGGIPALWGLASKHLPQIEVRVK